jgi:hypothetical protein
MKARRMMMISLYPLPLSICLLPTNGYRRKASTALCLYIPMQTESKSERHSEIDSNHPLSTPERFKHLPLVVIFLLILNLLATCHNSRTSQMGAQNRALIYVQTPQGNVIEASPKDPLYRSDATISLFVEDWVELAYTWKAPPSRGEAFIKERGIDFPYQFHAASFAIEPGYREAYMDSTAREYQEKFPFANYISGRHQSIVRIFEDPKIVPVSKGVWDVQVVATRTHVEGKSIFAHEIFNRVIRVRAVKPNSNKDKKRFQQGDTYAGTMMEAMQRQGLQIVEIVKF